MGHEDRVRKVFYIPRKGEYKGIKQGAAARMPGTSTLNLSKNIGQERTLE